MSSQNEIVKLNVGGTLFQSTKSTLTKFDGFFKTMLETAVPIGKSPSGDIFIDRDPTHFRVILNFMRDGDVDLPESEKEVKEISREAQYYLLDGLVELCSSSTPDCVFKILKDGSDVIEAVGNSKKPVLIILVKYDKSEDIFWNHPISDWKQFIKKHEGRWNILFKANSEYAWIWRLYFDDKYHLGSGKGDCVDGSYSKQSGKYNREIGISRNFFDRLEFHMNRFLDETIIY